LEITFVPETDTERLEEGTLFVIFSCVLAREKDRC